MNFPFIKPKFCKRELDFFKNQVLIYMPYVSICNRLYHVVRFKKLRSSTTISVRSVSGSTVRCYALMIRKDWYVSDLLGRCSSYEGLLVLMISEIVMFDTCVCQYMLVMRT